MGFLELFSDWVLWIIHNRSKPLYKRKKAKKIAHSGTWTHNLLLRRQMPYPIGPCELSTFISLSRYLYKMEKKRWWFSVQGAWLEEMVYFILWLRHLILQTDEEDESKMVNDVNCIFLINQWKRWIDNVTCRSRRI